MIGRCIKRQGFEHEKSHPKEKINKY